jgi:hypothetical protein
LFQLQCSLAADFFPVFESAVVLAHAPILA